MRRMASTDLLTTAQAADVLEVSVATVHRMEADGELPVALKVTGLRGPKFFRAEDVHALAERRAAEQTAEAAS